MDAPPLYLTLGTTAASRKRRLCSRMQKQAEANARNGLSTRIPFLKSALCGQETLNGESVPAQPRKLDKDAPEGHSLPFTVNYLALFRLRSFWDDIMRFNSFNASRGLQAISLERPVNNQLLYRVTACDISYVGDLRIARVTGDESGFTLGGGGVFSPILYGIALSKAQSFYSGSHIQCHEIEHARHHSLWHLAGFPFLALPSKSTEYLAMLKTLIELGEAPQLLAWRNEFIDVLPFKGPPGDRKAHDAAALMFIQRLTERYGMTREEVALAIIWTLREEVEARHGQEVSLSCAEHFERMKAAAFIEYRETYARLFGMSLDDLRDVVSRLSM
ncbi:hypothetical protein H0O00_05265 [Candidatus Micrarchaeota archaeon]|nr:hypothetical protein [Candidatus Micrarchaeota archaeon]